MMGKKLYAQFADETLGGGGKSSIYLRTSPDEYESKIDDKHTMTILRFPANYLKFVRGQDDPICVSCSW